MADAPSRVERIELTTDTWNGVNEKLRVLYSARSGVVAPVNGASSRGVDVIPCSNSDNFEKVLQQQQRPLVLPVIAVSLTNVDPNEGSYNRAVMRKHGVPVRRAEDGSYLIARVAPVTLTLQVLMVTDDLLTMIRMIDRWMANDRWSFELGFAEWKAKIAVQAENNLSVPTATPSSGGADQFRLVTNLKASTYAGYVWRIPRIESVQLQSIIYSGDIDAAMSDPSLTEVFHSTSITKFAPEDS